MDKDNMKQLLEAAYTAAGFASVYRDALIKAGFTREEACTMVNQLLISLLNDKK